MRFCDSIHDEETRYSSSRQEVNLKQIPFTARTWDAKANSLNVKLTAENSPQTRIQAAKGVCWRQGGRDEHVKGSEGLSVTNCHIQLVGTPSKRVKKGLFSTT